LGPTTSSVDPFARVVSTDGSMRSRQLETSDAVRADDTWMTGFDARSSGPLVELQAASAIVAASAVSVANVETGCKDMRLQRVKKIDSVNRP
jgi:hypothetical protein